MIDKMVLRWLLAGAILTVGGRTIYRWVDRSISDAVNGLMPL